MPAIYGFVGAPTTEEGSLSAIAGGMQRQLAHRAADGFNAWSKDGAWMGHGAFHLAAPPRSAQPLRLDDGRILLVDGFVANDEEVRGRLGLPRQLLLDDVQLFALAIQHWKDRFHEFAHGEFAMALWDPRARTLDLWCDHLGARPLCYAQTPEWIGFASEAAPLLRLPDAPRQVNPLAFATMWCDQANYQDLSSTAFEGIHQLPPAHHLRLQVGAMPQLRRYWRLQPREPIRLADEGQYVEAFREVFGAAVDRVVRGAGRAGLMLSGGIDSGAILAARRGFRQGARAEGLLCVSAVAAHGVDDPGLRAESANIDRMTAGEREAVRFEVPAPADLAEVAEDDVVALALARLHPVDVYLQVSAHACRLAHARGCRLMLNGIDGDNVMGRGAYPMADLLRAGQWRQAWHECRSIQNNTYLHPMSPLRVMGHALYHACAPGPVRRWRAARQARGLLAGLRQHPVLRADMVERLGLEDRVHMATQGRASVDPQRRCDHRAYWIGYSMRGADGLVARNGMEMRFPWSDLRVLAFFEQVPPTYLSRHGWTKYLARKASQPALGASTVWHTGKHHLGVLLNQQIVRVAGARLALVLAAEREALAAYYRPEAIDTAIEALHSSETVPVSHYDAVLGLACMAGWLRQAQHSIDRG